MNLKRKLKSKTLIFVGAFIVVSIITTWVVLQSTNSKLDEKTRYIEAVEYYRNGFIQFQKQGIIGKNSVNPDTISLPVFYPVNEEYRFKSKIYFFSEPDTVTFKKTKGGQFTTTMLGYVKINYKEKEYKLNVSPYNDSEYIIWFRDLTNGETTYSLGRYLMLNNDKVRGFEFKEDFEYDIDFNFAYFLTWRFGRENSSMPIFNYNKLDFAVEAGERFKIKE